jgi:hypothetical protein
MIISPPIICFTYRSYSPYQRVKSKSVEYYTDGYIFWTLHEEKKTYHMIPKLCKQYPRPDSFRVSGTGFEYALHYLKYYQQFRKTIPGILYEYTPICDSLISIVLEYLKEIKFDAYISQAICGN